MMHGDALVVVLILIFGCAAFFFGLIYALGRCFAWMGRGVTGLFRPRRPGDPRSQPPRRTRPGVCPNEKCRHVEYRRGARYCGQCGASLS